MDCDFDNEQMTCSRCGKRSFSRKARSNCLPSWTASRPLSLSVGPGTELSKLLKRFGIEPTPTCQCRAKAAEMDSWGPDECEKPERIEEVLAVMREEAKARGLPFLDVAGRLLIRRAIANARRAALDAPATVSGEGKADAAGRPPSDD